MKSLIVIFGCIAFVAAGFTGENKEELVAELSKCAEESGASDDDVKQILGHEVPESKNGVCTMACFLKKHDLLTAENTVDIEAVKSFTKKVMPNHEDLPEELIKVLEDCNKEVTTDKDECDAAKNIMECVMPKVKEHIQKKHAE